MLIRPEVRLIHCHVPWPLVTGAAQGIGQAMALALAERGAHVIATGLQLLHET